MRKLTLITDSPDQTRELGRTLGQKVSTGLAILLSGDLGAGKTCLTQGLARGLGVPEQEPVVSPSYTLMNQYRGRLDLYHFDLYRLVNPDELADLGFEEYIAGEGVTIVEWADRFPDLAVQGLRIDIGHLDENRRQVTLQAQTASAEKVLDSLVQNGGEKECAG